MHRLVQGKPADLLVKAWDLPVLCDTDKDLEEFQVHSRHLGR